MKPNHFLGSLIPYAVCVACYSFIYQHRQILDEVEIRELLLDHVGHRCCWGSRPARTWTIRAVEDCNVYVGTLETFAEDREILIEKEPYLGGDAHGKAKGPELGIWELDLRSEFPPLFVPEKESRITIPHSEAVEKCSGASSRIEFPLFHNQTLDLNIALTLIF